MQCFHLKCGQIKIEVEPMDALRCPWSNLFALQKNSEVSRKNPFDPVFWLFLMTEFIPF